MDGASRGVDVSTCRDVGNEVISLSLQRCSLEGCLLYSVGTTGCKKTDAICPPRLVNQFLIMLERRLSAAAAANQVYRSYSAKFTLLRWLRDQGSSSAS